jgi:hypothetical protein
VKEIPLTQGQVALIDDEDYELVSQYHWYAQKNAHNFYAKAHRPENHDSIISMHSLIMGAKPGQQVDHKNSNACDNRKENLRFCTGSQNKQNQKSYYGTSKYKGISWVKRVSKWEARILVNGKKLFLGLFSDEIEAAKAYNNAAQDYFGEFAKINIL